MRLSIAVLAILAFGVAGAHAGDAPYLGKWKLNPAKSDFGEVTIAFEEMSGGEMRMTADGQSFTFRLDGKDYPTPWGDMIAWTADNPTTWRSTSKVDGKVTSTSKMTLGPDGKTLNIDSKMMRANGETSNNSSVYQRVSGASGLTGKWKTRNVSISSPGSLVFAANGADGVTLTSVEEKGSCEAKFDGKDHPAIGPNWPKGWTCAIAKSGMNGLDVTWKKDGRLMYRDALTVSADGKVLTDVSSAPAASENVKAVYERQ